MRGSIPPPYLLEVVPEARRGVAETSEGVGKRPERLQPTFQGRRRPAAGAGWGRNGEEPRRLQVPENGDGRIADRQILPKPKDGDWRASRFP